MGYYLAGHSIVGVDIKKQPRYPFPFILGDALEYIKEHGHEYDAIHTSPPCQGYSKARKLAHKHPMLVETVRELLVSVGRPYVIENTPPAPLIDPIKLVGTMFGLYVIRPRWFEVSFYVEQPLEPLPRPKQVKMGRPIVEGDYIQVVGHFSNVEYARKAMGIGWMTRNKLAQAMPPAYTSYICKFL